MKNKKYQKQTIPYLLLIFVILGVLLFYNFSQFKITEFTYDQLIVELSNETVKIEITLRMCREYIYWTIKEYNVVKVLKLMFFIRIYFRENLTM